MEKGDIFWAKDKDKHPHPIVFLEKIDEERFKACILSTKPTNGNILMSQEHFDINNENGKKYDIQFKNSHLVPDRTFYKENVWIESDEVQGKLTGKGLDFIKPHTDVDAITLECSIKKYIYRTN